MKGIRILIICILFFGLQSSLVSAGTWQQTVSGRNLPEPRAPLVFQRYEIRATENGDLVIDPGELVSIRVFAKNMGDLVANSPRMALRSDDAEVTIGTKNFNSINPGVDVWADFNFRAPTDKANPVFLIVTSWTEPNGDYTLGKGIIIPVNINHCFNGIKDEDEEGIDCGGSCPACPSPEIEILDFFQVQVIRNFTMVLGKETLVRAVVLFDSFKDGEVELEARLNISWDEGWETPYSQRINLTNGINNVDFRIRPQKEGEEMPMRFRISTLDGSVEKSTEIPISVIRTNPFRIQYIPVDEITHFNDRTAEESSEYLFATYPFRVMYYQLDDFIFNSSFCRGLWGDPESINNFESGCLLWQLDLLRSYYRPMPNRIIGIVPMGWFDEYGINFNGQSINGYTNLYSHSSFISDQSEKAVAHEIGHSYGLCDEYDEELWRRENFELRRSYLHSCPNGDKDRDMVLDEECRPTGCSAQVPQDMNPLTGSVGFSDGYNIMGSGASSNSWFNEESFSWILFKEAFRLFKSEFDGKGILIRGILWKNDSVILEDFSIDNYDFFSTPTDGGNYSIILLDENESIYEFGFNPIFFDMTSMEETQVFFFSFILPSSDSLKEVQIKKNDNVLADKTISENPPLIEVSDNFSGRIFEEDEIQVEWESSDLDGDELSFTIQISPDSGETWRPLSIYQWSSLFIINSSRLQESENYILRVIANDGTNTVDWVSALTFSVYHKDRGDVNDDQKIDIGDAIFILNYLFGGGQRPECLDTADANNDERIDIADAIFLLEYLFIGGKELNNDRLVC